MKTKTLIQNLSRIIKGASALIFILILTSCTPKIPFSTSQVVPAAKGYVKVKTDNNRNYEIQITISDLAEISRLIPLANIYVAWIRTEDGLMKNIGSLTTSNNLRVSFKTVSSFEPSQVLISAEKDANISSPQGQIVLTTELLQK